MPYPWGRRCTARKGLPRASASRSLIIAGPAQVGSAAFLKVEALPGGLDVGGVDVAAEEPPPSLQGSDPGRPGPAEGVEDRLAGFGDHLDPVAHGLHRLLPLVEGSRLRAAVPLGEEDVVDPPPRL